MHDFGPSFWTFFAGFTNLLLLSLYTSEWNNVVTSRGILIPTWFQWSWAYRPLRFEAHWCGHRWLHGSWWTEGLPKIYLGALGGPYAYLLWFIYYPHLSTTIWLYHSIHISPLLSLDIPAILWLYHWLFSYSSHFFVDLCHQLYQRLVSSDFFRLVHSGSSKKEALNHK